MSEPIAAFLAYTCCFSCSFSQATIDFLLRSMEPSFDTMSKEYAEHSSEKGISMPSRILAINDDEAILDLYTHALEPESYEVSLALVTIKDAKEIERVHPDLIILDVRMRGHDAGLLLLEQLKQYRPTKDIPVILCTAAPMREQEDEFRQKGIPILYKPFDLDDLLDLIQRMLPP